MIYVLVVCLGILWGDECEIIQKYQYPTLETCLDRMRKAKEIIGEERKNKVTGYAYCVEVDVEKKKQRKIEERDT